LYLEKFGTENDSILYKQYIEYNSMREDEILKNVINCNNIFEKGILLIGALHRKTIIKKIKLNNIGQNNINWILYYGNANDMIQ
jgi:hypothetical protein